MQTIPTAAPADIIEALVNQEQSPSTPGIGTIGQRSGTGMPGESIPLVLHLPDQPIGRQDPPDPQALVLILCIAMTHGIDESLMQAEFDPLRGFVTDDGLRQQLKQGRKLKGRGKNEFGPTKGPGQPCFRGILLQ